MQNGYPPINIKYSNRKRYYEAFDTYYKNQDAKTMIDICINLLKEILTKYLLMQS